MTTATTRSFSAALGLVAAMGACVLLSPRAVAQQKTLKFVPEADLRSLDPIWTTAYITRNYGYMVYDTMFAVNENFEVRPQMIDKWTLSEEQTHLHIHVARRP
jgi:peptide/nickel transport system substrate-binding protein